MTLPPQRAHFSTRSKVRQMAILLTKKRNKLKATQFGLPGQRKYPMPDASHARDAKARASEEFNKGRLSAGEKSQIDAEADKKLKGK